MDGTIGPLTKIETYCMAATGLTAGRMLELGSKSNTKGSYKVWFETAGFEHVSVDLNGEDGALVRDLARPGSIEDLGHFDVVTNFGTTEHVPDQVVVWRQVHNAVKPGGWLISTTPSPGTWQGHGAWYPMLDWYCEFGIQNHYRTRMIGRFVVPGPNRQLNVYVAQREEHPGPWHEFQMPDAGLMRRNDEGHVGDYSADFVVTSSTGEPPRYSKYQQILRALTATLPGMDAHETALAYVRGVDAIVRAKPGPPTD